jgi:hypothetical protein
MVFPFREVMGGGLIGIELRGEGSYNLPGLMFFVFRS